MNPLALAGKEQISRRSFLWSALSAATCSAMMTGCSASERRAQNPKQLNIYSWADYIHPKTIPEFERRYGLKVVYDTFSSNESLLAKMQAGATQYNIVVPTSYMVTQLRKLTLLDEIQHDRLPSLAANIKKRFQNPAFDPGLRYSVPYTWGTTGIGFDTTMFESRNKNDWPRDWDIFWDDRLRGRLTLLDDARETIGMSIKRCGHSFNTVDTTVISSAASELMSEKPLVMCYTSDQVIVQLAAGDSALALGYSGDVYQVRCVQQQNQICDS